jgi:hypothetical protein
MAISLDAEVNYQERLAVEVRSAHNGLVNAILVRRAHPTYGYTKADIRDRWNQLLGLAAAYALAFGLVNTVNLITNAHAGLQALGIDYVQTQSAVIKTLSPGNK